MEHEAAENLVLEIADLFRRFDSHEPSILVRLEDKGYSRTEARKLFCLVQSAFGWAALKQLGIKEFSPEIEVRGEQGEFSVPIMSQPIFMAAFGLADQVMTNGYTDKIDQATLMRSSLRVQSSTRRKTPRMPAKIYPPGR